MRFLLKLFSVVLVSLILACSSGTSRLQVHSLTVEGRDSLSGTDILQPRLSWKLASDARNLMQSAYEIEVASSLDALKSDKVDLWKSGKISSDASVNILYAGQTLPAHQNCFWRVRVWTNDGQEALSEPAYWSVGFLDEKDWKAKWIGLNGFNKEDEPEAVRTRLSARYLRKEFKADKKIKQAVAYVSGMGLYELYLNGTKVGQDVLAPGVTEYNKRIFYNTYDVTDLLKEGGNCAGVILGNGRFFGMRNYQGKPDPLTSIPQIHYGLPKLRMEIRILFSDGTVSELQTDESWSVTDKGPILANNEYDGEIYDATRELNGWNIVGYSAKKWNNADIMPADSAILVAQPNENIRVKQIIRPIAVTATARGTYFVDMGQNMVGWIAIKIKGEKGDTVRMRFAETMRGKDSLYLDNMRNAKVTDTYILNGKEAEEWEPRFVYHGFRYVEISGLKNELSINDLTGKVIYDDIETIGTFETSDTTINAVYRNAYWTIRGNYRGMPTDCPQRDERVAWLGDRVISSYGESFLFDNSRLYAKWLDDINDAQKENGSLPDIAPSYWDRYADNVTYPSAFILIPDMLRKQFGDTVSIRKHYPAMKKWIWYMWKTYNENDLVLKDNYGDWCVPPESLDLIWSKDPTRITDGGLLASSYYYHCLNLMKEYATRLGHMDDAIEYQKTAARVLTAFNKKFYNAETKSYANNTVTANLLPLRFDMVPEQDKAAVFQNIRNRLNDFNDHVNSGIIGGMWMMRGLTDNGAPELAYKLATNKTYPSWGYMIEQGATTIWELWNGDAANPMMNSGNHQMLLGDLLIWYYEYLAGIKTDKEQTAFKKIIMSPIFPAGLNFVKATLNTKYGEVKSHWIKSAEVFEWVVSIPPNTSADISLPVANLDTVKESGDPLAPEIQKTAVLLNGKTMITIGSGTYRFTTPPIN